MSKRYTAEFKRDAIALIHSSGRTVTEVTRGRCHVVGCVGV
ncbi:hypothetical protein ACFYXM_12835 [Streptomyces sp. NPDC002476]